ncbi:MAG: pilin [Dokdonella sp.]|nr:pilin [Dokdonella sp.]
MHKALLVLLSIALLGALGFAAWQWQASREQQARLATAVADLRESQQQVQRSLQDAERALTESREEQARMRETLVDEATLRMRDDLVVAGAMRVAVAEFHAAMGRMPTSHAEAGLPEASHYRGQSLRSASLLGDGSIELVFDASSGVDGGRVRLVVDASHADAMGLQWHCVTSDYPLIKRVSPACDYVARDAPSPALEIAGP